MMIITPNSLVRQKKGAQGEQEKEAGGRRNAGSTRTPTSSADATKVLIRSKVSDARNRRKH